MSKTAVFWIGPQAGALRVELLACLEAHGLCALDIESADALLTALRLHAKAVIVVCDHGTQGARDRSGSRWKRV